VLRSLYIRNFAIVDEALISFEQGFNIITGETGVGKSLLIGALNVALGERAFKDLIREGSDSAIVEAVFEVDKHRSREVARLLDDNELAIRIKREIRVQGASRVWINGRHSTVQELKQLGDLLVDLHGQHEHQYLLNEEHHLEFLDDFAGLQDARQEVNDLYDRLVEQETRLESLDQDQHKRQEQRELYRFQLQELNDINPQAGELEKLEEELKLLENAQEISEVADEILKLTTGPQGAAGALNRIIQLLDQIGEFSKEAGAYLPEVSTARVTFQEIGRFAEDFQQQAAADPQRLEKLRSRESLLNHSCQKYNRTYEELLEYHAFIKSELGHDEPVEVERDKLVRRLAVTRQEYSERCAALSTKRSAEAVLLTEALLAKLQRLGIPRARFEIQVEKQPDEKGRVELGTERFWGDGNGMDRVTFWMQANPGEPLRPLARIASGGEVSRVMLALKASMSGRDRVATIIFDEIDAGISGKIARVVGRELRSLAQHHQLVCITHLPQIASLAETHYRVEKQLHDGRTVTRVNRLNRDQQVAEIAVMVGDGKITDASRQTALELLA